MQAIVLDGHLKSALAAVRSLGVRGVELSVGSIRDTAMGMHSKYARHKFVYPSPYTNQHDFVQQIKNEAIRLGEKPIVFTFSDATFLSLYAHREILSDYITIDYPDIKSVEIAFDKAATYSIARVSGVPTIATYAPETKDELRRISTSLSYPAVIKTRRSVTWHNGIGEFGSASFVQSPQQLEEKFLSEKKRIGETPLIQEFIEGEEYGVEMLAKDGMVYAQVVHHRMRSLSPTGGASVLKETLAESDLKHVLIAHAETLVEKLQWTGPIMVEFKVDADSRKPYLMEVNGRFWGSLPLSIAAGVDVPLLYAKALGSSEYPHHKIESKKDVTTVHRMGDVLNLIRVVFAKDPMRKILYPRRNDALRDFFRLPPGVLDDVWLLNDPKPWCMEIVDIFKSKLWK